MLWTVNKNVVIPRCFDRPLPLVMLLLAATAEAYMDSDLFFFDRFIHQRVPARLSGRYFPRDLLGFAPGQTLTPEPFTFTKLLAFIAIRL